MTLRDQIKASAPDEYPPSYVAYILSKLCYLAAPYMHVDPYVRQQRFEAVTKLAGELMLEGFRIFSPLTHNHPIAQAVDMPRDWEFWRIHDIPMLAECQVLFVYKLPGWSESKGVAAEVAYAKEQDKTIIYILPQS